MSITKRLYQKHIEFINTGIDLSVYEQRYLKIIPLKETMPVEIGLFDNLKTESNVLAC